MSGGEGVLAFEESSLSFWAKEILGLFRLDTMVGGIFFFVVVIGRVKVTSGSDATLLLAGDSASGRFRLIKIGELGRVSVCFIGLRSPCGDSFLWDLNIGCWVRS